MAKETQKEKIARLEAENAELKAKKEAAEAAYNELAFQKKPEEAKVVTESEEYQSLKKQLAEERIRAAEAQRLYQSEAAKREQLRQDYVQLKERYDTLETSHNTLESDLDAIQAELQEQLQKATQSYTQPHNARGAGRKPTVTTSKQEEVVRLHEEGMSSRKIAEAVGLSSSTVLRILRTK